MNKTVNHQKDFRIMVLACLFLGCSFFLKAQNDRVFPLSSKQFEHCEGDQFYINFWRYDGIMSLWDNYVFSALQHNKPVKNIKLTVFIERMVYDEPTMVEDKKMSKIINYTGDYFVTEGKRIWKTDGISWWLPSENSLFFETRNRNTKGTANYIRDEQNRVKRVDFGKTGGDTRIMDFTYWLNTDNFHTIKCYNDEGKMISEVKFDYLTTSKKTLLKGVTCKIYNRYHPDPSYPKETFVYRLNYNSALEVNQVDLFHEEKGEFNDKDDKSIKVDIVRDQKGNIQTCTCTQIKCIENNIDRIQEGFSRSTSWQFTYDNNNNWTTMTKTQKLNGKTSKYLIKRELDYGTPKSTTSSSSPNTPLKVYSNAYDGFVNIRQAPQSKAPVVGVLRNGPEGAVLLGAEGEWKYIDCNGIKGYVYEKYVQNTPTEVFKETASNNAPQSITPNPPKNQPASRPEKQFEGEVFTIVEEMPEFPGGMGKLAEYLAQNINYPQTAQKAGVQGKVFVNFVVEPDGSVSNVKVIRSLGGGCDEEAVRVVKAMPQWRPGKQRGQAVRVSYNLPINFKLQ